MVINTSLPVASPQPAKPSAAKPALPAAGDSSSLAPLDLSSSPEITTLDGARQSQDFARNSILNQSSLALLAQGNLSPDTVYSLLQP
jgi:hypothetical protein